MTDPTLVEQLAAFAVASRYETLPDDVVTSVRQRVLDILGICLAASTLDTSRAVLSYVADQGGAEQAHALTLPRRVPAAQAAFANGVLAHSLDYDDTHLPSILHPSAPVVPAVLAAAEVAGASGRDVIAAAAVGLEVCVRLGMAGYDRDGGNSMFFDRGQHATSICGAVAGAAAAALLLAGTEAAVADAMGIAASMASGVIEANRTGGTVKRLHAGFAARAAVTAAELATRGITGPPTVLEGRFGFFAAFLDGDFHPEEISDGLGERWSVPGIFFKPYPANHFTHTTIDAAIRLREHGLRPADVAAVDVGVAAATVRTVGEPIDIKRTPDTGYQAQFSAPYTFAAALIGGGGLGLGLDDFSDELARDPARRTLMALVDVRADERCTAIYPHQFPAIVRVRTTSGEEFVEEVLTNRGGPERPLSDDELAAKFHQNATRALTSVRARAVAASIADLDTAGTMSDVLADLS